MLAFVNNWDFSSLLTALPEIIISSVIGFFLGLLFNFFKNFFTARKELKDNNNIDISGDWYARWQTSVNRQVICNTEKTKMKQKGRTISFSNIDKSSENPTGGYLWTANLKFYNGQTLMGWYFPKKEENITSKGIIFLTYFSQRNIFLGKWAGQGFDGPLQSGYVVIAKDPNRAKRILDSIQKVTKSAEIMEQDIEITSNIHEYDQNDR